MWSRIYCYGLYARSIILCILWGSLQCLLLKTEALTSKRLLTDILVMNTSLSTLDIFSIFYINISPREVPLLAFPHVVLWLTSMCLIVFILIWTSDDLNLYKISFKYTKMRILWTDGWMDPLPPVISIHFFVLLNFVNINVFIVGHSNPGLGRTSDLDMRSLWLKDEYR